MEITTIGVDLAKNVFQVHAVDERGKTVLRKQLRPCDALLMANVSIAAASSTDCRAVAQIHVDAWRVAYDGIVPSDYLAALSVDQRETMWRTAVERGTPVVLVARTVEDVVGWIASGRCRDDGSGPDVGEMWAI